jgi:hypothetical protein
VKKRQNAAVRLHGVRWDGVHNKGSPNWPKAEGQSRVAEMPVVLLIIKTTQLGRRERALLLRMFWIINV